MKTKKNNLDERQELQLLHIEKQGCWLIFWGLLAAIVVQLAIFGVENFKVIAGEWCLFMLLAIYMLVACLRKGIWDRHMKANPKTNLLASFLAAVIAAVIFSLLQYIHYRAWQGALATFVVTFLFIFVLCIIALSVTTAVYKRRVRKLEHTDEDE